MKRPMINIEKIKMQNEKEQLMVTQSPAPSVLSARKRKKKTTKTHEEIIQQSHQQILSYIDSVDDRVQDIIKTYEVQFLSAYQEHIKRVRQQMEEIKRRSLNSASSQSAYLDRIDALQKQLRIFREDSSKLFDKLTKKDLQINILNSKVKELQNTVKEQENKIFNLIKKSKESEVAFEKVKEKYQLQNHQGRKSIKRFTKSQHKHYPDLYTPFNKQLLPDQEHSRPYSTQLRSNKHKNMSLRIDSHRKKDDKESADALWIRQKIQEKVGSTNFVPINTVIDLFAEKKISETLTKRDASSSFRRARTNYMTKMESKKSSFIQLDNEIMQKSKEMAQNNELKEILKNSIEQVRKDMTRRTKNSSLNFFKSNGPKNYEQFKKVDHFTLLELLLNNQVMIKALYQIIFQKLT